MGLVEGLVGFEAGGQLPSLTPCERHLLHRRIAVAQRSVHPRRELPLRRIPVEEGGIEIRAAQVDGAARTGDQPGLDPRGRVIGDVVTTSGDARDRDARVAAVGTDHEPRRQPHPRDWVRANAQSARRRAWVAHAHRVLAADRLIELEAFDELRADVRGRRGAGAAAGSEHPDRDRKDDDGCHGDGRPACHGAA